jgi:hypothetical protein
VALKLLLFAPISEPPKKIGKGNPGLVDRLFGKVGEKTMQALMDCYVHVSFVFEERVYLNAETGTRKAPTPFIPLMRKADTAHLLTPGNTRPDLYAKPHAAKDGHQQSGERGYFGEPIIERWIDACNDGKNSYSVCDALHDLTMQKLEKPSRHRSVSLRDQMNDKHQTTGNKGRGNTFPIKGQTAFPLGVFPPRVEGHARCKACVEAERPPQKACDGQ